MYNIGWKLVSYVSFYFIPLPCPSLRCTTLQLREEVAPSLRKTFLGRFDAKIMYSTECDVYINNY